MAEARRTDAAERDLQDIAFQIACKDQRPITADRIVDGLVAECERLATSGPQSEMGTAAPQIGVGVRLWTFRRWVILFRYEPHGVDILRFADGSQDFLAWKLG